MKITNRLRRAGILTRTPATAATRPLLLALAALALTACQDGFFFDPAQTRDTRIAVTYTLVEGGQGASSVVSGVEGEGGPQLSPGAAFDKANGAQVVLRQGENELFNQRLPLEAAGSDKKLSFSVELPAGSVVQASLSLTLLRGQDQLFTGAASAQLTPGQSAEVTVPLQAVVSRVAIQGGPFVIRTLGGTVRLTAAGLFATGDLVGPVAPTYQALTPNVTVAADGTVTAATNGEGRVAATYLGRADTAVVMVEDRCFGPFTNIALGQTVTGTLEPNDCLDTPNFSYNDWYFLSLTAPTLFRATLRPNGFEPFVGVNQGAARTVLGVAADQGTEVVSEYYLPAGGFLPRVGSRARTAGPVPTGSYTLSLEQVSEPQAGCWQGASSVLATWMRPGMQLSGRLAADDCQSPPGTHFDMYGVRFVAGDTGVVRLSGDFPLRTGYGTDTRIGTADGQPVWWAFTSDGDLSHYIRIFSPGVFGNYDIRVNRGIPADYDACANPRVNLGIGAAGSPTVKTGRLQRRIDCEAGDRVRDDFVINSLSAAFQTTLQSNGFNPFISSTDGTFQKAGRANATGSSVVAEHLYPAGREYTIRVIPVATISSGGTVEGSYTLSAAQVPEPQNGCFAGAVNSAFVDFGSVANGRITRDDCRDLFAPDTATVTRWVDGYSILLQEGQSVTVTFTPGFPANFVRWIGATFIEGQFGVQPGQTRSFTVTQGAGAAFHSFYAISGEHEATGAYTMTFSGGPGGAPAAVSAAPAAAGPPEAGALLLPQGRGGMPPGRR